MFCSLVSLCLQHIFFLNTQALNCVHLLMAQVLMEGGSKPFTGDPSLFVVQYSQIHLLAGSSMEYNF